MVEFDINYANVATSELLCEATRSLARDRMTNPYMTVGEYFKSLNDEYLEQLLEIANREDDDSFSELILLSEMLSRGEGVITEGDKEIGENVGYIRMLIAAVSLHRKGMVKVNYDKISFSRDMMDCVIIEKI